MLCLQLTELCFQQLALLALLALLELGMPLGLLGALAALCVLLLPRLLPHGICFCCGILRW